METHADTCRHDGAERLDPAVRAAGKEDPAQPCVCIYPSPDLTQARWRRKTGVHLPDLTHFYSERL